MGWDDYHLHNFDIDGALYGDSVGRFPAGRTRQKSVTVITAAGGVERFVYVYDFGDSWEHEVTVEAVWRMPIGLKFAACVDGANVCPPEDCGALLVTTTCCGCSRSFARGARATARLGGRAVRPDRVDLALANARLQSVR